MPEEDVRRRLAEVLEDLPGGAVSAPTGLAARAVRRRRARLLGAAVAGIAVLAALGGVGLSLRDGDEQALVPAAAAPRAGDAARLVGQWQVTVDGRPAGSVSLRGELTLTLGCGRLYGDWKAESSQSLFVASNGGGSTPCYGEDNAPPVDAAWITTARSFRADGSAEQLLGASGRVVAVLTPEAPTGTAEPFPTEALTADAAPVTRGRPAAPDDVTGVRWEAPGGLPPNQGPSVSFEADGTWGGSDGCNGIGGRYVLGEQGRFLATSGPQTLAGCNNSAVSQWVTGAARVAILDNGDLGLFDADGALLGTATRPVLPEAGVPFDAATAPEAFTGRAALPSCGAFTLKQGERAPAEATACLAAAAGTGRGAELALSQPTVEGDPIVTYSRALLGGGFELFVDSTRDGFGGQAWVRRSCTEYLPRSVGVTGCGPPVVVSR